MGGSRIKTGGKVFRDPVHELIRIEPGDDFILDLIDTPEFQRLRRIRQLGVSSMTYHGAEHSRFVHSLGVFHLTQRISESLRRRYGPTDSVSETLSEHSRVLKSAALLHDIGHAPFSHLLERAFENSPDHEDITVEIIKGDQSSVGKVLKTHGIDPQNVAAIIEKTFTPKFIVDIVSSQLDADRMDYLLRDSLSTGVSYGHYDSEWLLHAMCVAKFNPKKDDDEKVVLCLDRSKGVFAAERFVMARMQMYQQVYLHRVTRGYETMLLNLFRAATFAAESDLLPTATPEVVNRYFKDKGELDFEQRLAFDESQIFAALHVWASSDPLKFPTIQKLSYAFLNRRRLYRALDISSLAKQEIIRFHSLLSQSAPKEADGNTPTYGIDWAGDTPYKGVMYRVPKGGTVEELANGSILVTDVRGENAAHPIEEFSEILRGLDAVRFDADRLYFDVSFTHAFRDIANAVKLPFSPEAI